MKGGMTWYRAIISFTHLKGDSAMRNLAIFLVLSAGLLLLLLAGSQSSPACAGDDGCRFIAAGGAKLEISDLIIRKKANQINLRAVVTNPGATTASGLMNNLTIHLFVKDEGGKWKEVKTWSNIEAVKPGDKVARDYTPIETLTEFKQSEFTVKAVIKMSAPVKGVTITKATIERSYPKDATIDP
jgi:hypothetical protein